MKRFLPTALLLFGGIAALAQPRWGVDEDAVRQRGIDLLVCLDVSRSMLARDLAPDRLGRARLELHELINTLGADRIGLILFAGEAQRAAPLTSDHASFLSLLDLASPLSVRQGGTDLASALSQARVLLEAAPGTQKNVLLITDGEDRGGRALAEAEQCRADGITLFTLGIGTEQGSKITLTDGDDSEFYLKDKDGNEVISRLDRSSLIQMAEASSGRSIQLNAEPGILRDWYLQSLLPRARDAATGDPDMERANRYQIPLALALFGAILAMAGFSRRRS
ncbi:MAG: VWA domain-containing protein [Planctomycetes bacterium]|nr:VWA domain-containing protein [Planctomycetota bacterium]MCP4769913.1 VWA domain-containing protein [Planctomycetota bacterium]MCP4859753.1 VWA domain-containing protein [Planctomycetota bacterium]